MSIDAKAKELAEAIKETEEFETLKSAENKLNIDVKASEMLQEFQDKQQKLQESQQNGEEVSQEEIQSLQSLQQQMQDNDTIKELMDAQKQFDNMLQEVNQTVITALK